MSRAEVAAHAREVIRPGFLDLDEAVERVEGFFDYRPGLPDAGGIPAVVTAVWQECLAEQESWPDEGDSARLSRAFAALEADAFVARMNFTCCPTCGHSEIGDECSDGEHSYVFFHSQDAERLSEPDATLYLAFGYFDDHPDLDRGLVEAARRSDDLDLEARAAAEHERVEAAVGARIVDALRREGMTVDWDGTCRSRPAVSIDAWRRKLPTPS